MYVIRPVPKRYVWGSYTRLQSLFCAELLSTAGGSDGPLAEMWFSGHPQSPSRLIAPDGSQTTVLQAVRERPEYMLGRRCSEQFGPELPFLFKIIAARIPLSLQVHPVDFEARAGFNAQNALGIAQDAPERSFHDAEAKSEMVVALEPFEASVGFSPISVMLRNLSMVAHPLAARMVEALTERTMRIGQTPEGFEPADAMMPVSSMVWPDSRRRIFRAFHTAITAGPVDGLESQLRYASLRVSDPVARRAFHHALAAAAAFPGDPSVLTLLMLNPVSLQEGESVFIPAGTPHAYIHGMAAEIMNNSDNVLRAGMTVKHKDIPRLLHTLNCQPGAPVDPADARFGDMATQDGNLIVYTPHIDQFMLAYGHTGATATAWPVMDRVHRRYGILLRQLTLGRIDQGRYKPRIVLCTSGAVRCSSEADGRELSAGQAVFVPAAEGWVSVEPAAGARTDGGSFLVATTQV
ncbi:mannose-6-phosphate isomerase, class I [Bifidobacterium thermophilum]|uniref:mannose-6-phosphate isomerase, class I n=1 Tax=Bifidobacterium thermophilum TaxID=33905 RepID=UPI0030A3F4B1